MNGKIYLYILVCAAVSFLIRELPLTLIRRPIKSRFLRSFLFYVPYVTLAVMTFPSIVNATQPSTTGFFFDGGMMIAKNIPNSATESALTSRAGSTLPAVTPNAVPMAQPGMAGRNAP